MPATVQQVFGKVTPPPGGNFGANPVSAIGSLVIFGIKLFLVVGALSALFFLLWGAYDWIISNGDPDLIAKARQKMTNAVIGIVLALVVLGLFVVITSDVLHIMTRGPKGEWQFGIPSINQCLQAGQGCSAANPSACCSGVCNASNLCQ